MLKKLAKIKYLPNNFQIIEQGDHVECAVSKKLVLKFNLLECGIARGIFSYKEHLKREKLSNK